MMWARLAGLTVGALFAIWAITRVPVFQRAYVEHQQRLEDDAWLRKQCADPHFVNNMRRHTSVCDDARAAFARPPWIVAMQACLPDTPPTLGWEGVALVGLVLFLLPSLLWPVLRARYEHQEHQRVLDACSASLIPWPATLHQRRGGSALRLLESAPPL
jgi:hypothetical protein